MGKTPKKVFYISLVYQNARQTMLRTLITQALNKEEALGITIEYFNEETKGFWLILKAVTENKK